MQKECLVTVGATAKFPDLIRAVLSGECLQQFATNGFTHLNIQFGHSEELFNTLKPVESRGLEIRGFPFDKDGLNQQIRRCQAKPGLSEQGIVICHAGAGTILDVMRLGVPLIVVANQTLLDNHQEELADELARQGYVTKGSVNDLPNSVDTACKQAAKAWGGHQNQFSAIIDGVAGYDVGYEEEVRARLD